jgi:hypothetical protein
MAAPKKEKYRSKDNSQTGHKGRWKKFAYCLGSFLVGVGVAILVLSIFDLLHRGKSHESLPYKRGISTMAPGYLPAAISSPSQIRTLEQLLTLDPKELENVDIGLMNLLCAQGLKGTENLDIEKCLATLNEWAEVVRKETENRMDFFRQHSEEYDNSVSVFKMANSVFTLKHLYGVHYNLDNMKTVDYSDSSQIFIHGLLSTERNGSCVSIPVLYAAIAHRLGYPVRLVHTAQHSFLRWDDGNERFNVEASTEGCATPPDEHYREFPRKLSEFELKTGPYLKSMSAAEELSSFLIARGHALMDMGMENEANIAFAYAFHYSPDYANNLIPLAVAVDKALRKLWETDCKIMGTKEVRYTSFSGFSIDPRQAEWTYPCYPVIIEELARKSGMTPRDLLSALLLQAAEPARHQNVIRINEPPLQYKQGFDPRLAQQQTTNGNTEKQQPQPKPAANISDVMNRMANPNQK